MLLLRLVVVHRRLEVEVAVLLHGPLVVELRCPCKNNLQ